MFDGPDVKSDGSGMGILGNLTRVWVLWLASIIDELNTLISSGGDSSSVTNLGTTIAGASETTPETKGDHLSVKMFGALGDGLHDDAAAINTALATAISLGLDVFIPDGNYVISARLILRDASKITVYGNGPRAKLIPSAAWTSSATENVFDISGSKDVTLRDFSIDGVDLTLGSLLISAVYGDGTVANPSYGPITVKDLDIDNWPQQGIGVGATTGNTVTDVVLAFNKFHNFGSAAFGNTNAIDTGSSGTKLNYKILYNDFDWNAGAISGESIFSGHGTDTGVEIHGNNGTGGPGDFIQIFGRPFGTETVSVTNYKITNNFANTPGLSGIAIYGLVGGTIMGNHVLNPGTVASSIEGKSAIFVTHGSTGATPTNFAPSGLLIALNVLEDNRGGSALMTYGVYDSHAAGFGGSGHVGPNFVFGASLGEFGTNPNDAPNWTVMIRGAGGKMGFGPNPPVDNLDSLGNIRAALPANPNLFHSVSSIEAASFSGSQLWGMGFNVRANTAGGNWLGGTDGANSGVAAILFNQVDGAIRYLTAPSTGSPQTFTPAALAALVKLTMTAKTNGMRFDGKIGMGQDAVSSFDLILAALKVTTTLNLSALTPSLPLQLDAFGNVISAAVSSAPTGPAGGALNGTYPNPGLNTVPVTEGGTSQTSLAAHGVLIGQGTSGVAVSGAGTSGQVLTSNGASADPTFQDPLASLQESMYSTAFTALTTSFVQFASVNLTPGTWKLTGDLTCQTDVSSGDVICQIYDQTNAVILAEIQLQIFTGTSSNLVRATMSKSKKYVIVANATVILRALVGNSSSGNAQVFGDASVSLTSLMAQLISKP